MISCNDVRPMLPGYLDGELSEAQSAPMRGHLMDCCACREQLQEGKVLSRWFREGSGQAQAVPRDFSARIARRAFAGDPGLSASNQSVGESSSAARPRPLLPFLLKLTAAAAVLLFLFALQLKRLNLPDSENVEAGSYSPPWAQQQATPAVELLLGLPAGAVLPRPLPAELKDAEAPLNPDGDPDGDLDSDSASAQDDR